MLTTLLSCTYLGAALCYAASPSTAEPMKENMPARWLRAAGLGLLGLGLGMAMMSGPVGEGILVWLSAAMAAASLLVIAAPLVDRFVPVTAAGALAAAVIAPWL